MKAPVLIELGLIINKGGQVHPGLLPALAELNQADRPLVLIAERPDGWKPTRNKVDQAFQQQQNLEAMINRGGGMLDAILYLDFSLFVRQRNRIAALIDLADRYDRPLEHIVAITAEHSRVSELLSESPIQLRSVDSDRSVRAQIDSVLQVG